MENRGGNSPAEIGRAAEDRALVLLQQAGLRLLERNFRCRLGEIDLVMRDGTTVVFVEVRQRRSSRFGSAAESVSAGKLRRVRRAAELWLRRSRCNSQARIDVVTLDGGLEDGPMIRWIRGADAQE